MKEYKSKKNSKSMLGQPITIEREEAAKGSALPSVFQSIFESIPDLKNPTLDDLTKICDDNGSLALGILHGFIVVQQAIKSGFLRVITDDMIGDK